MSNVFAGIGKDIAKAFDDVKSVFVKAASEAPAILSTIEANAPEVSALASLAFPTAGSVVSGGVALLEEVASVIKQGGASAEQNFLNAGLDQATIAGVKSLLPAFEAYLAAAKK